MTDKEHELLQYKIALTAIKRSVDRLWDAVAKGQFDARSIVGDEALRMMDEYIVLENAGHKFRTPKDQPCH